jgi:signal transduction histidine kinase
LAAVVCAGEPPATIVGLPFTRLYSFADMGDIARGARLSFDEWGRILAVQDGVLLALNDNEWIGVATGDPRVVKMQVIARDESGKLCYGAKGSFGILRPGTDGLYRPETLVPSDAPKWINEATLDRLLCRPDALYFASFIGLARWDRATHRTTFFAVKEGISSLFAFRDDVCIAVPAKGVLRFDQASGTLMPVNLRGADLNFDHVVTLPGGRLIMSTFGRRLYASDGENVTPIAGPLGGQLEGRISALVALREGLAAVAINGRGLFVIKADGEVVTALTNQEYRQISDLATNEPGVLWAATENGIAKILYGGPLTTFGRTLGLPILWPQVVPWRQSVIVASNGRIFEPVRAAPDDVTHFQLLPDQPDSPVWALASFGDWLLLGNFDGLYSVLPGQKPKRVLPGFSTDRLIMLPSGLCFAVGKEITAIKLENGAWVECAERVPGVGYPSVVRSAVHSAWIETGANQAVRLSWRDGKIQVRRFDRFPWSEPLWINVSVIGDTVMLAADGREPIYFDETKEEFSDDPSIKAVLKQAPYAAVRVEPDRLGRLWVSHAHGLFTLRPDGKRYVPEVLTYQSITDHVPLVWPMPSGEVWISSGASLHHAAASANESLPVSFNPVLVSIRDVRTNRELRPPGRPPADHASFSFDENSVELRFFAGGYALNRPPRFEYQINQSAWSSLGSGSVVRLLDLREGVYRLNVRLVADSGPLRSATSFTFSVAPPWYRKWYTYLAYAALLAAVVALIVHFSLRWTRQRNVALEKIVAQRTEELRRTMQQLQRETHIAATLTERNRLAGEIHDSVQQGLSGSILQLETTMDLVPPDARPQLDVVIQMLSYTREEVQHAVLNLESPLLQSSALGEALQELARIVNPGALKINVATQGDFAGMDHAVQHNLLRIAQEAITNAVKHAHATHVDVSLEARNGSVQLIVVDNGVGFDPDDPAIRGRFGLRGLHARARSIKARLLVKSSPGAGTAIEVTI